MSRGYIEYLFELPDDRVNFGSDIAFETTVAPVHEGFFRGMARSY